MIDSSGIGAAGGGAESGGGAASDGGAEWWDLSAAPLDQLAPADELPPDLRRPSAAELTAGALAVLRTPGLDPGVHSVGLLARLDITRMSLADRIDAVAVWARAAAWWDGIGQQLLAAVAAADRSEDKWVRDEVAAVLALASVTAGAHLAQATAVTSRLPAVLQALLAGEISGLQARAIVEASYQLPDELAGALEAAVLGRASEQTLSELKRSLRRAVLRLDPATAEQRRVAARADRHVRIGIAEDGMAQLWALLPAADAQAIHARLDVTARLTQRADPSDSRTRDQLRADALTAAVLAGYTNPEAADPNQSKRDGARDGDASDGGDGAGEYGGQGPDGAGRSADAARRLPREQGRRPGVNVIVGLSTLLGEDDEPAELEGYGPIAAGYARELCHDPTGTWRRLVTDPVGTLVEVGRCVYRPPAAVRDHVTTRNPVCSFPGCNRRSTACDLDHCVPWPHGRTSVCNLHPVCRRHHRAKHEAGWKVKLDPDGTTHWTSPTGHDRISRPPTQWAPDPPNPLDALDPLVDARADDPRPDDDSRADDPRPDDDSRTDDPRPNDSGGELPGTQRIPDP